MCCVCVFSCCHVQLFGILWTTARQTPLSMEFFRQEYWDWLPFPTPGDLPNPRIEPVSLRSPVFAGEFFTTIYVLIKEKYNIILQIFTSTVKSHKILLLLCLIDIHNHHFHHWIHIGKYQYFPMLPE